MKLLNSEFLIHCLIKEYTLTVFYYHCRESVSIYSVFVVDFINFVFTKGDASLLFRWWTSIMVRCQNVLLILKITVLCVTCVLYVAGRQSENPSVHELYEIYGLKNPFIKTKPELSYEKRRHKLETRWGCDIDVS